MNFLRSTPSPQATTIPEPSYPAIKGIFFTVLYYPAKMKTSEGWIVLATTFIKTSPFLGLNTGTSCFNYNFSLNFSKNKAFIVLGIYSSLETDLADIFKWKI